MRGLSSAFTTPSSIERLRKKLVLCSDESGGEQIVLEPCREGEPIFLYQPVGSNPKYFYMYETFFTKLNVRLPFSDFECDILRTLNVAPSQMHPNSWGFVRAFYLLCKNYDILPTPPLFFYFFQAKQNHKTKVSWVSLNSFPGRSLLSLFNQSYKHFETRYFRVRNNEFSELIADSSGGYKFPLYWTSNPAYTNGTDRLNLSAVERVDADFLETFPLLNTNNIISLEFEPAALRQYFGNYLLVMFFEYIAYIFELITDSLSYLFQLTCRQCLRPASCLIIQREPKP